MHPMLLDRTTAPLHIGDVAPDFDLLRFTGKRRWLSDHRGAPVVVAFHPPQWDPTLADQIEQYKTSLASRLAEPVAETFLVRNDDLAAMRFGVDGSSAVFVIDASGMIAWRYISGVDPLPHAAADLSRSTPSHVKSHVSGNSIRFAAVVANAIYHATRKRVRELPVQIEKIL